MKRKWSYKDWKGKNKTLFTDIIVASVENLKELIEKPWEVIRESRKATGYKSIHKIN